MNYSDPATRLAIASLVVGIAGLVVGFIGLCLALGLGGYLIVALISAGIGASVGVVVMSHLR